MADRSKDNKTVALDPSRSRKKSRSPLPKGQKASVVQFPKGGRKGQSIAAAELERMSDVPVALLKSPSLLTLLCLLAVVGVAWIGLIPVKEIIRGEGWRREGLIVPSSSRVQMAQSSRGGIQLDRDLVEIAPEEKRLVEAKINPGDVTLLQVGDRAAIRLTTDDFAGTVGLEGVVDHISTDTITDKEDNSFYLVRIRADKSQPGGF